MLKQLFKKVQNSNSSFENIEILQFFSKTTILLKLQYILKLRFLKCIQFGGLRVFHKIIEENRKPFHPSKVLGSTACSESQS